MAKAVTHAKSMARRWGGVWQDYIALNDFMDSSKGCVANNKHRIFTHNSWFIGPDGPLERCFGKVIVNSDGKEVPTRELGEQHIAEDFHGVIPTPQDYLENLTYRKWYHGDFSEGRPHSSIQNEEDLNNVRID